MVGVHPGEAEEPLPGLVVLGEGPPSFARPLAMSKNRFRCQSASTSERSGSSPTACRANHRPRVASQLAR